MIRFLCNLKQLEKIMYRLFIINFKQFGWMDLFCYIPTGERPRIRVYMLSIYITTNSHKNGLMKKPLLIISENVRMYGFNKYLAKGDKIIMCIFVTKIHKVVKIL